MKKEEVIYRGDNKITPITAKILIDEADYYHSITSDDWFVYKAPKKTTYSKKSK